MEPATAGAEKTPPETKQTTKPLELESKLGLVYRIEIHLPETQNIETYRSIFKALREELMP